MDESFLEAAERAVAAALEEARKKSRPAPRPEGFNGACVECDVEIPLARIRLGYYSCIRCRSIFEQRQRCHR